jgi:hypothetical protein
MPHPAGYTLTQMARTRQDERPDEPAKALSIGSVVGGNTSENAAWREALKDLRKRVTEARRGVDAPLNVNIVFHVPGHLLKPEHAGVRTGSFSSRRALLMVQVALPEIVPSNAAGYLIDAAYAAVDEAGQWAERHRVPADMSALHGILQRT